MKDNKNTIVKVTFNKNGIIYSCLGVLLYDNEDELKIAFNAYKDKVMDSLIINKKDVLSLEYFKEEDVEILK